MDGRPHLRVADVFRSGWEEYKGAHRPCARLVQAARHITECRTSALGGRLHRCGSCGAEVPLYNSCRDRHCSFDQMIREDD